MAALLALLAVVAGAILGRLAQDATGLGLGLPGEIELARHMLMIAVLSALPGAAARGLVRVDLLAARLPRALDRVWDLALALVAGLAARGLALAAARQAASGEVSQVLALPLWPVTGYGALALAVLALGALARALAR